MGGVVAQNLARSNVFQKQVSEVNNSLLKKRKPVNKIRSGVPRNDQGAIIDYHTKNRSWVNTKDTLKLLGIKNSEFHLILLNPLLQGVDPYDPNITPQQALWVTQECSLNIFYYLREVVRVEETGGGLVSFALDRGTLAALYCFYNNINFYLIKPRQTGKTTAILAMLSWAFKFGGNNSGFMFNSYTEASAKKNLKSMTRILKSLPSYLSNAGTVILDNTGKKVRKTDNAKSYREPGSNNEIVIAPPANTPIKADEIGRGYTQNYQYSDECEFIKYIDIIAKVSGAAFNTASRNAKKNGVGYCRIFSSTPGDLGNKAACQSALKIVEDSVPWSEKFYDDDINETKKMIKDKSEFKIVYIQYSYKQLGLSEDWFLDAVSNIGGDPNKVRREILLERFSGTNLSPFTPDELEDIKNHEQQPIGIKKLGLYDIWFYEKPKKKRLYFIAIDPSSGTGGDNYAFTVLDPYTLKTVAELSTPYMTVQGCIDMTKWLMINYFDNPLIIVERNYNGGTIAEYMKSDPMLRNHLYSISQPTDDKIRVSDNYDENGFIKEEFIKNKYFGLTTTPKTRPVMMNILLDAGHYCRDIICSHFLIKDIQNLVVKNDKIQAASGEHDDSVMSWLLAMYVYYHGDKLERYGFDRLKIPNDVEESDEFERLSQLYRNPEVRKNFPTMYAYFLEEKKKREKKSSLENPDNKSNMKHLGALSEIVDLTKVEKVNGLDDDSVSYPLDNAMQDDAWRKDLANRFMSLNNRY